MAGFVERGAAQGVTMGGPHKKSGRKQGQTKADWYWSWAYEVLGTEIAEQMIREAHATPLEEIKMRKRIRYKTKAATA